MKKVILALALMLVCAGAWAQLNVKSKSSSVEQIDLAVDSKAALGYQEKYGYILLFVSSNRYDGGAPFRLGDDLKGAIRTLDDLLGLYDTLGSDIITVEPWPRTSCTIKRMEQEDLLRLQFEKQAGHCDVWKKDLEKFRTVLEKRLPPEGGK